jgi:hypothetical protein
MATDQLNLFPEPQPQPFDVDAFATHIAEHAPKDPYIEQRVREYRAAGLDPLSAQTRAEPAEAEPETPRDVVAPMPTLPLVETPTRDRDNWQRPTQQEIADGLTDKVRSAGQVGIAGVQQAFKQAKGK